MRGRLSAVLAVSAVLWCGAVRAEETLPSADTLAPKETIAFIQTAPLGDTKDSLDAFGNAAVGMLYGQVSMMVDTFQASDVGKAIDWKRPLGVAILRPAQKGSEPGVVFYIPEVAAGALQKAAQKALADGAQEEQALPFVQILFASANLQSKGGYVICTEQGFKGSVASGGRPWKAALKATAVAVVDLEGIRQAFGDELEAGIQQMEAGIGMMGAPQGGTDPARILKAEIDLFRRLSAQSARVEVGLDLSEARLALKTLLAPRPGTTLEKLVSGQQPGIGRASLATICGKGAWMAGEYCWTLAGGVDPVRVAGPIFEAMGIPCDAAMQKRLRTICADGAHQAIVATSVPEAALGITTLVSCADAQKAQGVLESQCALLESMKVEGGVSYKPIKAAAGDTVRTFEIVCKADPALPQAAAMIEAMYGKSPTCGVGASGDKIVCAIGGDGKTRAAKTLAGLKGPAGTVPAWYTKLTAGMPAGSQWRGGVGLLGLARIAGRTMESTAGMNPFAMLDKMALEESGLGVYGFASKGGFEAGLVIPAETVALGQQLAGPLMMMGAGGMQEMPPQIEEGPQEVPEEQETE